MTPLGKAVFDNDVAAVKELLACLRKDMRDDQVDVGIVSGTPGTWGVVLETPVMIAVQRGNIEIVKLLLKAGAH